MCFVLISAFLGLIKQEEGMLQDFTTYYTYQVHMKKMASPFQVYVWNEFSGSWSTQPLTEGEIWNDFLTRLL